MSAERIAELKMVADRAEDAWKAATAALHDAMKAAHPIQPGDVLTAKDGRRALVRLLAVKHGSVEPVGVLRNKDGTWGHMEGGLYRFEWQDATISKPDRQTP